MCLNKKASKTKLEQELGEVKSVADEKLEAISGGTGIIVGQANPWEDTKGVPQQPIDKKITKSL